MDRNMDGKLHNIFEHSNQDGNKKRLVKETDFDELCAALDKSWDYHGVIKAARSLVEGSLDISNQR